MLNILGFNNATVNVEECIIVGGMGWMDDLDYKQCQDRSMGLFSLICFNVVRYIVPTLGYIFTTDTSLQEVLWSTGCPSRCMVNCEETRFTVELSASNTPGFMSFCGGNFQMEDNVYTHVACQVSALKSVHEE